MEPYCKVLPITAETKQATQQKANQAKTHNKTQCIAKQTKNNQNKNVTKSNKIALTPTSLEITTVFIYK